MSIDVPSPSCARPAAVIFDCDGVLIDSEIVVCRIVAEEFTALGFAITVGDVIARFAGRPDGDMRAEIEQEWGRPIPAAYGRQVDARVEEAYAHELQIIPGVVEAIDGLALPYCVASSSGPAKLRRGLEAVGLYERFAENAISGAVVPRGKPEPDVFLYAAGWLHTAPLDCLVIEDSVHGVSAARKAGIPALGFAGGSHCTPDHGDRLMNAGAIGILRTMFELPGWLASCSPRR